MLAQSLTFGLLWLDLPHLVGEERPADVLTLAEAPIVAAD